MRLEAKKFLYDIEQAVELLMQFTSGKSFVDYSGDAMLRAAVEREFEIIGEALARLAKVDESLASKISDSRRIVALRNILIHGYAAVDNRVIWDLFESKVGLLQSEIKLLLREGA